jgi:hypothetical protein
MSERGDNTGTVSSESKAWVNIHIATLKKANVIYAETLDNFLHSTRLIFRGKCVNIYPEDGKYNVCRNTG